MNKIIHGNTDIPQFTNEYEKAKWRRVLVRDNLHIVNAYFMERIKNFIKLFFSQSSMEYKWYWFRVEYQSYGTAHIYRCLRLKNNPGIDQLTQHALKGRIAEY